LDAIETMGLAELHRLSATLQSSLAALDAAVVTGSAPPDGSNVDDLDPDAVIRNAAASSSALSAEAAADLAGLLARFDARKAALLAGVAADRAVIAAEVDRLQALTDARNGRGGRPATSDADAAAGGGGGGGGGGGATKAERKRGLFRAASAALAAAAVAYGVSGAADASAGGGGEAFRNVALDAVVAAVFAWLASREDKGPAASEGEEGGETTA